MRKSKRQGQKYSLQQQRGGVKEVLPPQRVTLSLSSFSFPLTHTNTHTHSIPSIHWFSTSYIHPTFPSGPPPPPFTHHCFKAAPPHPCSLFHLLFPPLLFTLSPEQETRGRVGQWLTPSSCCVIVNVRMWVNARACARARPRHSLPPVKRLIQAAVTRGSLVWAFSSLTGAKTTDSFMSFYSMWYFILCDVFFFFFWVTWHKKCEVKWREQTKTRYLLSCH